MSGLDLRDSQLKIPAETSNLWACELILEFLAFNLLIVAALYSEVHHISTWCPVVLQLKIILLVDYSANFSLISQQL